MAEDADYREVLEHVRTAIKRSGRKQAHLAKALGMSASAFSRLLKQGRNLKLPQLQRIAVECEMEIGELVGSPRSGEPEAWRLFHELILLEMPPAVAYDLATGRGGLLSGEERRRLNAMEPRLRENARAGATPATLGELLAPPEPDRD